ncbi:hypothetical protein ACHQM5_002786 [Ranunculus cassubicifolius]
MEEDKEALGESKVQQEWKPSQGGFRATMFVYVLVAFENMGFVANMSSLFLYFAYVLFFDGVTSANTLTNFLGTTFLFTLIGGFISDVYLNRLHTCLVFGVLEVLALGIITYQAHTPKLRPALPCGKSYCIEGGEAVLFYVSLFLYALGAGGVRGSVPALGGDQFNRKDPKESKSLDSYFNWFLFSITLGAALGVTLIVKLGMSKGWDHAFFTCMIAAFVGFVVIAIGKPFYRIRQPGDSPILSIKQVIVVAFRNRKLTLPQDPDQLYELNGKDIPEDYQKIQNTHQFRFLDKAAILPKDAIPQPGEICTVTQVEEVKVLTRMLPIIASTIIMNTCLAQLQTFSVQQGSTMNLHLGSFLVPPPSIPVIPLLFMAVLVPLYEYVFIPLARKITNHQSGITQLQRVGVGLVLSAISMAVAGVIEVKRRKQDIKDSLLHTQAISLFWLSFQYGIFGIADLFTLVGLLDFFYKEAPNGMKSLSTSFTFLSLSIGYFLSSVFVSVINSVTSKVTSQKKGWLAGTINENRLEYFYWFLAVLSCLNFANYLFWASWYKYKQDDSLEDFVLELNYNKGKATTEEEQVEAEHKGSTSPSVKENITQVQIVDNGSSSSTTEEATQVEHTGQSKVN